jgi:hypothetical protein
MQKELLLMFVVPEAENKEEGRKLESKLQLLVNEST